MEYKKVRSLAAVASHINRLKKAKQDFTVRTTNYTTTIECNGVKTQYIERFMNDRVFRLSNRIKKDVNQSGITVNDLMSLPFMQRRAVYFNSQPFIENYQSNTVINIDIKSAYPTTFYNSQLIKPQTFEYLNKVDKNQKLAALGMLAARSNIMTYSNGIPMNAKVKDSKHRAYFIFAVRTVDEIMNEVSKIAGDSFLYFWVDGIYLKPSISWIQVRQIMDIFRESAYNVHTHTLNNFDLILKGDTIHVSFSKDGEQKLFQFPDKTGQILRNDAMKKIIGFEKSLFI